MIRRWFKNQKGRAAGFGACYRCGDTWNWKPEHQTPYDDGRACFPLCEECWQQTTTDERLPYYRSLMKTWIIGRPEEIYEYIEKWEKIHAAVKAGL